MEKDQPVFEFKNGSPSTLEQGEAYRREAAAEAEPRLVHPDEAADGRSKARSRPLQSGNR